MWLMALRIETQTLIYNTVLTGRGATVSLRDDRLAGLLDEGDGDADSGPQEDEGEEEDGLHHRQNDHWGHVEKQMEIPTTST